MNWIKRILLLCITIFFLLLLPLGFVVFTFGVIYADIVLILLGIVFIGCNFLYIILNILGSSIEEIKRNVRATLSALQSFIVHIWRVLIHIRSSKLYLGLSILALFLMVLIYGWGDGINTLIDSDLTVILETVYNLAVLSLLYSVTLLLVLIIRGFDDLKPQVQSTLPLPPRTSNQALIASFREQFQALIIQDDPEYTKIAQQYESDHKVYTMLILITTLSIGMIYYVIPTPFREFFFIFGLVLVFALWYMVVANHEENSIQLRQTVYQRCLAFQQRLRRMEVTFELEPGTQLQPGRGIIFTSELESSAQHEIADFLELAKQLINIYRSYRERILGVTYVLFMGVLGSMVIVGISGSYELIPLLMMFLSIFLLWPILIPFVNEERIITDAKLVLGSYVYLGKVKNRSSTKNPSLEDNL